MESNEHSIEEIEIVEMEVNETPSKENDTLYAFVGEQVSFERIVGPIRTTTFLATYKVLENVYNYLENDTIEFIVYDHWGRPEVKDYKHSLLFISTFKGKLYHEKYQFFDVYKTKDGQWASIGDPYKREPHTNTEKTLRAEFIEFDEDVYFDLSAYENWQIVQYFPKEFYAIKNGKAYPIKGNYSNSLLEVKKNGILKARGWELE